MDKQEILRRTMFVNSFKGLSAAWVASNWPGIAASQAYAQQAAQSAQPAKWGAFSPEEAVEVEAVAAQIIPTDDTPGAREARVIHFIDHALVTFERDQQHIYAKGLPELQAKTKELFPSAGKFSALQSAQQIQVLKAIEKTPFFTTVRNHTVIGFFASPVHGGNHNKAGWKLIGYDDSLNHKQPFGYYDARESRG
jgi:gluconate 2-dehydrogenase gamma chain